jgi:hypothetical protein
MRARDRQATPRDLATTIADPFVSEPSLTTTPNDSFRTDASHRDGTTSHLAHCSPRGTPLDRNLRGWQQPMIRASPHVAPRRSSGECERETGRQLPAPWQVHSQIPSCPSKAPRQRQTIPFKPILPLVPVDSGTTSHPAHCSPRGTPLEPDFARPGSNRSGHLLMVPPTVFRPVRARDRQTAPSALAGPVADPFMSEPSAATRLNHPAPTTVTEGADRIAAGHLGPSRKALSCLPGARRPVGNVAAFTPGPRTREVRRPHTSGSRCKTNHVQITVTT